MTESFIELASKNCANCKGSPQPLAAEKLAELLAQVPGWERVGAELIKTFRFKNYYETMAFINATAWISHREDHHPDIDVGYNQARIRYSTHSAGGLTESDFICAAKIEALMRI